MQEAKSYTAYAMDMPITIAIRGEVDQKDIDHAFALFKENDAYFSRFNDMSMLTYINTHPDTWIDVSGACITILSLAQTAFEKNHGLFDIRIGAFLEAYGYTQQMKFHEPSETAIEEIRMNHEHKGFSLSNTQVKIDTGIVLEPAALVKTYTIQQVYDYLSSCYDELLINGGGDVLVKGEWDIGIQSPMNKDSVIATIRLSNSSVCTSGSYIRNKQIGSTSWHHIIDPRTGKSSTHNLSISIIHPDMLWGNIWATALFSLPYNELDPIAKQENLTYLLIDHTQHAYATEKFKKIML